MKCYILKTDYYHKFRTKVFWSETKDGPTLGERDTFCPYKDLYFEAGGNTWQAKGKLTPESKAKIGNCWASVQNHKKPLQDQHLLGVFNETPTAEIIVDDAFVEAFQDVDPNLFDFTSHNKIWDHELKCELWDRPAYIATVLPLIASYDPEHSKMELQTNVQERFKGKYNMRGLGKVRYSTIKDLIIWRDSYSRHVLCTDTGLDILKSLNIRHFWEVEIEVVNE